MNTIKVIGALCASFSLMLPVFARAQYMPSPSQAAIANTSGTISSASSSPAPLPSPQNIAPLPAPAAAIGNPAPTAALPSNATGTPALATSSEPAASGSTVTAPTSTAPQATSTAPASSSSLSDLPQNQLLDLRDALLAEIAQLEAELGLGQAARTPGVPQTGVPAPGPLAAAKNNGAPAPAEFTGSFTRDLTVGNSGPDALALQQFLNAQGYMLTATGPGSPGEETEYFGTLTKNAVARFQIANDISPASGFFGPQTRAIINSILQNGILNGGPLNPDSSGTNASTSSDVFPGQATGGTTLY